jgi:hypothetical protein
MFDSPFILNRMYTTKIATHVIGSLRRPHAIRHFIVIVEISSALMAQETCQRAV